MFRRLPPIVVALLLLSFVTVTSLIEPRLPASSKVATASIEEAQNHLNLANAVANEMQEEEFVEFANVRREQMKEWIVSDPQRALDEAITWSQYEDLPKEMRPLFEKPFNTVADLLVLPVCGQPTDETIRILEVDGESWTAHVFGRRIGQMTKENTPLSGITLDELAAVRELPFEPLSQEDANTLAQLPIGNTSKSHDYSSGVPLPGDPVTALAGGKRYLFSNESSLSDFNKSLAAFDEAPGPHAGAQVYLADGADGGEDGFQWDAAGDIVQNEADNWTETPKSVFFIRVEFFNAANPVTQSQLSNSLNIASAASILEMSYGKTTINATVSAATIMMPQPVAAYLPDDNTLLRNEAIDAYELINGAGSLSGYDVVGVHFPSIGIKSGSVTYAGLAGGSRQWLQGTYSSGVIIHEFGHNYGLGHSGFWDTTDGSVVGTGSNITYGDSYDIMGSGPDPEGHFHMQGKQRLNWLESSQWIDASASGSATYRVYPFDNTSTTGLLRGLRMTKASSPSEYYWLGYRTQIPDNSYLQNGAFLLWQLPTSSNCSLLDTTPDSLPSDKVDCAIAIGTTYSDTAANVHITPVQKGGSGADTWIDINTQFGPFPGNISPTATLNVPATIAARTPLTISVSANDGNSDPLAYSWDLGDGSFVGNITSFGHEWTVGGSYTVSVTVSDMKGGTIVKTARVTVTDPLDTWTAGSVGVAATLSDVEFLDGRFIATGNGAAYFSVDGQSWQSSSLGGNFRSGGIATNKSDFVIAGYNYDFDLADWVADIHRSADGLTWQKVTLPIYEQLRDVAFGGDVFVAIGDAGTILLSSDSGETWTPQSAPGISNLKGVTYGNGTFIAVGETSVYSSANGVSWTDRSSGHSMPSWQSLKDVIYENGTFIAGGYRSDAQISTDNGMTWTRAQMLDGREYDIESFAATDGILVAAGDLTSGASGPVQLVSSNGGLTWKESANASFPNTSTVTFGNGSFVTAYGSSGETSSSNTVFPGNNAPDAILTAPSSAMARTIQIFSIAASDLDGDDLLVLWDLGDGSPLEEGNSIAHSFASGGSFTVTATISDRRGGIITRTQLLTITDPLNSWTQRTSNTSANLSDIAVGGGKLVAVGSQSGSYTVSTDGLTWTSGSINNSNLSLSAIIHDGSQFVAVGQDYDFGVAAWIGVAYTSPDATTWTRQHESGAPLEDVAFGNGAYVAVGDTGTLWHSTDAATWTPVPSGLTENLNGVTFGSGVFVIAGSASNGGTAVVLKSADGQSWTNTSAGANTLSWQGFYDIQFANNRFLASGWYSRIRHSTDSGYSFSTTQSGTQQIPAFAYGNGVYLAAGIDKDNADADINLLSTDGETWTTLTTTDQDTRQAAVYFNNTFVTVGSAGAIWQSDPFGTPEVPAGFAQWQASYFPGLPADSAPNEDFDNDGIENLIEYATGTDPTNPVDRMSFSPATSGVFLSLTIPKAVGVTDIGYAVHRSTNLSGWETTGTVIVTDNASELTVRCSTSKGSDPIQFLRGVFTLIP